MTSSTKSSAYSTNCRLYDRLPLDSLTQTFCPATPRPKTTTLPWIALPCCLPDALMMICSRTRPPSQTPARCPAGRPTGHPTRCQMPNQLPDALPDACWTPNGCLADYRKFLTATRIAAKNLKILSN